MGKDIPEDQKTKEAWDSNAITPGTPFMDLLAASLRYWVVRKMNTDPNWRDVRSLVLPISSLTFGYLDSSIDIRFKCSRRGRAQNHGLHSSPEGEPGP